MKSLAHTIAIMIFVVGCVQPSDELLRKPVNEGYLQKNICNVDGKCVDQGDRIWFIDEEFVFTFDKSSGRKTYMEGYETSKIIGFHNQIVALQSSGDVWIAVTTEDGEPSWYEIGNSATDIAANEKDLIALTEGREIWAYTGEPGDTNITFIPIITTVPCGKRCSTTIVNMVPVLNGREIAFEKTGLSYVESIETQDGEVFYNHRTYDGSLKRSLF